MFLSNKYPCVAAFRLWTDHYSKAMASSDGYSNVQRLPQSSAPFLSPAQRDAWDSGELYLSRPQPSWSPNKVEPLHSDFPALWPSQRRPFCFAHESLYITVTSFSRAFLFSFLGLIYVFLSRSVVKPLFFCSASHVFVFIILWAAGISVFNDSCFVSILLALHETSGTQISFLKKCIMAEKKWKDEPLDQWF